MRQNMLLVFFIGLFLVLQPLFSKEASAGYEQGIQAFNTLIEDENRSKFRSYWLETARHFEQAFSQNPEAPEAADALFYLGRTYEELGKRSFLRSDFEKAEKYYTRTVRSFPKHDRAAEAQYRKAGLYLNHYRDSAQAYIEYLRVVYNFSPGPVTDKAQEILTELDRKKLEQIRGANSSNNVQEAPRGRSIQEQTINLAESSDKSRQSNREPGTTHSRTTSSSSNGSELVTIRHWSSDEYTRVVLDLDSQVNFTHTLLKPDPDLGTAHRLFIDMEKTIRGRSIKGEENIADGILNRIRSAQYTQDTSRVVLDIQDLEDFRVFALENPFRIVVDVYAPEKGLKTLKAKAEPQVSLDPRGRELAAGSLVEQLGLKVQTIMIDPGHGGRDPGAISHGVREKDVALRMSRILGRKLEAKGFDVLYTRTEDVFVPLEERTAMANSKKADLFISVHANAHRNPNVRGFEVYYLNFAQTEDAKRVAARENAVSTQKISDLQYILTDLMLSSKINESRDLAQKVHTTTISHGRQRFSALGDNGVRQAPFYVLMGAQMPSILLELGYLTNEKDRQLLQSEDFLVHMANGLTHGILAYKDKIEQFASLSY